MANFVVVSEDGEHAVLEAEIPCYIKEHGKHRVQVKASALDALNNGVLQRVLPNHTPEEREILLSGQCNESFDAIFPDEDDMDGVTKGNGHE